MYSRNIADLEEKLRLQEQRHGENSPEVVDAVMKLAHLNFMFNRYQQAESLYWRAVTIRSKIFGQDHLAVAALLTDLGHLYLIQERFAEAEHVLRLAYAIKSTRLGMFHDDVMGAARNVVAVCRLQKKHIPETELERMARVAI